MSKTIIKNIPKPEGSGTRLQKNKVFKGNDLKNDESVTIVAERGQVLKKSHVNVQPITENGRIVGVIHECSCGKKTEIRFDFEE